MYLFRTETLLDGGEVWIYFWSTADDLAIMTCIYIKTCKKDHLGYFFQWMPLWCEVNIYKRNNVDDSFVSNQSRSWKSLTYSKSFVVKKVYENS